MNHLVEIWEYLANKFDNECLADEIISFSVDTQWDFNNFKIFAPYPFMVRLPTFEILEDST